MIGMLLAAAALQPVAIAPRRASPPAMAKPATVEYWVLDQISFPITDDETYKAALKAIEPDHSMESVATHLALLGIKFERTIVTADTTKIPPELLAQLKALPPNEPFALPITGRMTINGILSRRNGPAGPGAAAPPAPTPTPAAAASIDRLLDLMDVASQFDGQIARMIEGMRAVATASKDPRADEVRAIVGEEVRTSFLKNRALYVARVRELYLARFTAEELKQLVQFYQSPIGRKATSMAPGISVEMTQFAQQMGRIASQDAQPRILERLRAAKIPLPQGT